jgi:hypothetical protein
MRSPDDSCVLTQGFRHDNFFWEYHGFLRAWKSDDQSPPRAITDSLLLFIICYPSRRADSALSPASKEAYPSVRSGRQTRSDKSAGHKRFTLLKMNHHRCLEKRNISHSDTSSRIPEKPWKHLELANSDPNEWHSVEPRESQREKRDICEKHPCHSVTFTILGNRKENSVCFMTHVKPERNGPWLAGSWNIIRWSAGETREKESVVTENDKAERWLWAYLFHINNSW